MPKAAKGKKFYAVQKGRQIGVFLTWEDCQKQTKGYPGAKYRSFANAADAEAFVSGTWSKGLGSSNPSTSSSPVLVSVNSTGKKRVLSRDVADESGHDVVYCDGACKGNGQVGSVAGVGVWWEDNDPRNIAERCPGDQTNNRAELIAIVRMLETTPKSKRTLLIKTDSQYCIKCFHQWLPKWERNNFRTAGGHPVKNVEIIKYVSALLEARALVGQRVRMEYVKGHSGDRGNDGADAQANKGALLPPVPERDWRKAKQELLGRLEEERKLSESRTTSVPVDTNVGVPDLSTDQPHKVRKVRHGVPFSRLSSAPRELSSSEHTDSVAAQLRSPSPLPSLPVVDVSSSPSPENGPSRTQSRPSTPLTSDHVQAESARVPNTPVRKHGVGLFTTTPPPNAGIVRDFLTIPREPQGVKQLTSVLQEKASNEKLMAMSVDVADVVLNAANSELMPQDQEANEKPMVVTADASDVDLNEESESGAQAQRENEKPMAMSVDAAGDDLIEEVTELVPTDQENDVEPVMSVDTVDDSIDAKESKSVPKDQEQTARCMTTNEDAVDVNLNVEVERSELVPMDQEETERSMTINENAVDICLEEAKDLEPALNDQETTEKPMVTGLDAVDGGLIGVTESDSVPKDEENPEESMTISSDTMKVDLTGPTELELILKGQRKTERPIEKPLAMSVDASDVNLNDYLDCVDEDDDPFENL